MWTNLYLSVIWHSVENQFEQVCYLSILCYFGFQDGWFVLPCSVDYNGGETGSQTNRAKGTKAGYNSKKSEQYLYFGTFFNV